MSRYIDADKLTLIKKLTNLISECEVIDIVRCKECKHRVVEEQSWGEYNEYCDRKCKISECDKYTNEPVYFPFDEWTKKEF